MLRAILVALFVVILPISAAAQDAASAATKEDDHPKTFEGTLAGGHKLYIAGNPQGALEKYETAKGMDSGRAIAYYFIGAAKAKLERYEEAVKLLRTAATIAGEKEPSVKGQSLFLIAHVMELSSDLDGASAAWNEYLDFAKSHTAVVAFVSVAQARMATIEAWKELQEQYAPVKAKSPVKGETPAAVGGTNTAVPESSN